MSVDFFRNMHEAQLDRTQQFYGKLGLIATVLSAVAAIVGYFVARFNSTSALHVWVFWGLIGLCVSFFCLSVFYLIRFYYGPQLVDLAPSAQWLKHFTALQWKHRKRPQVARQKFDHDLMERYAEAATHNQNANDRMGYALDSAIRCMIGALCAALLSSPVFFYLTESEKASKSESISKEEQKMPAMEKIATNLSGGDGPGNVPRPGEIPRPNPSPQR